jgi:hypothetical protein
VQCLIVFDWTWAKDFLDLLVCTPTPDLIDPLVLALALPWALSALLSLSWLKDDPVHLMSWYGRGWSTVVMAFEASGRGALHVSATFERFSTAGMIAAEVIEARRRRIVSSLALTFLYADPDPHTQPTK